MGNGFYERDAREIRETIRYLDDESEFKIMDYLREQRKAGFMRGFLEGAKLTCIHNPEFVFKEEDNRIGAERVFQKWEEIEG